MDVEASRRQRGRKTPMDNPYSDTAAPLHYWHPMNVLRRGVYIGVSLYGLNYFNAYETIMRDPSVSHEWFKFAIAASVALLFVKGYVEIYAGKLKNQKVSYASFPRSTHAAIMLILLSSLAYHIALWPAYGAKTMLIMFLFAMFLLHFCLLFPTYVQNLVAFIVLGFFLQEYK
ncbi:unnamed protein product [Cylindrotheca closterium]|uniref:Uncharacterized protein n=1 Tax=Cylindrotheca closterium TaxID=2856 RepID=A0AAD2CU08_9STRA|nr:unnamed protein product [Cylindrotheca closterium]